MNKQLERVAARRRELLTQTAAQRAAMAEIARDLQHPLAVVDAGIEAMRFIRRHAPLFAAGLAVLFAVRRKGPGRLAGIAWRLLRLYPGAVWFGLEHLFASAQPKSRGGDAKV